MVSSTKTDNMVLFNFQEKDGETGDFPIHKLPAKTLLPNMVHQQYLIY
jgi:hypothetical protein